VLEPRSDCLLVRADAGQHTKCLWCAPPASPVRSGDEELVDAKTVSDHLPVFATIRTRAGSEDGSAFSKDLMKSTPIP
jgi:hypothetical protein